MLKKSITYTDFNGEEVTEDFYFNFTRTEIMNLEVSIRGGMSKRLEEIIKNQDPHEMVVQFQDLILLSYGEKSEDGKRFIKNDELRKNFEQSSAYDVLIWQFTTDDKAASDFVNGIVPQNMRPSGPQDHLPKPPPPPSN